MNYCIVVYLFAIGLLFTDAPSATAYKIKIAWTNDLLVVNTAPPPPASLPFEPRADDVIMWRGAKGQPGRNRVVVVYYTPSAGLSVAGGPTVKPPAPPVMTAKPAAPVVVVPAVTTAKPAAPPAAPAAPVVPAVTTAKPAAPPAAPVVPAVTTAKPAAPPAVPAAPVVPAVTTAKPAAPPAAPVVPAVTTAKPAAPPAAPPAPAVTVKAPIIAAALTDNLSPVPPLSTTKKPEPPRPTRELEEEYKD